MALSPRAELVAAYSATGSAWRRGPERVYGPLAEVVVAASPVSLAGGRVLDLGSGTGAASRAAQSRGAEEVVGLDAARGMLAVDRGSRPPGVVGDLEVLPFAPRGFDAVVAAFALNHLVDPVPALREAARVTRAGGVILVSAYAQDDHHPVRGAVDDVARQHGWTPPAWHGWLHDVATVELATVDGARDALRRADLRGTVRHHQVTLADLSPLELVRWRCGMAHLAPFVEGLDRCGRARLERSALAALGTPCPPLVRSIIVLTARR